MKNCLYCPNTLRDLANFCSICGNIQLDMQMPQIPSQIQNGRYLSINTNPQYPPLATSPFTPMPFFQAHNYLQIQPERRVEAGLNILTGRVLSLSSSWDYIDTELARKQVNIYSTVLESMLMDAARAGINTSLHKGEIQNLQGNLAVLNGKLAQKSAAIKKEVEQIENQIEHLEWMNDFLQASICTSNIAMLETSLQHCLIGMDDLYKNLQASRVTTIPYRSKITKLQTQLTAIRKDIDQKAQLDKKNSIKWSGVLNLANKIANLCDKIRQMF